MDARLSTIIGGVNDNHAVNSHAENTLSDHEPDTSERHSREILESLYAKLVGTPNRDERKARELSTLGRAYHALYQEESHKADLEKVISLHEAALQCMGPFHPQLAKDADTLSSRLIRCFQRSGDIMDIERAIAYLQNAVNLTEDGDADKPGRLSTLGIAFQLRFDHIGDFSDLTSAISLQKQAMDATAESDPNKPAMLSDLGLALKSRFQRLGRLEDLEDAISNHRKAVELTVDGHSDQPLFLNNLGTTLQLCFGRLNRLGDLEDAISIHRRAVELTPDGHPDKPGRLGNLGAALQYRFERLGSIEDLGGAISNYQRAVEWTPDIHPSKPGRLNNLGIALRLRFERFNGLEDLQDAISYLRRAVERMPDGHRNMPNCLNNLGIALQLRCEQLGDPKDLEDAISNLRRAVDQLPDGHPDKSGSLYNLGNAILCRFKRLDRLGDLESALSAFSTAANSPIGPPMWRFKAARAWAKHSEVAGRSPLEAFKCAINLLHRIAWLGLAVTDQHTLLATVGCIVHDAVAAAIRYKDNETAVEWAEQGRSIVWQNLLELRTPVDKLRQTHPDIADLLHYTALQLEGSASQNVGSAEIHTASASASHLKWAIEWDDLIDKIREIPGLEGFLRAKSFRQLAPAAHEGPVVILNINNSRCDALILIAENSAEQSVSAINIPLERFSHKKGKKLVRDLTEMLSSTGVRERNGRQTRIVRSRVESDAGFKEILGVLWKDVVKPVIDGLPFHSQPGRLPRIWWCTTGLFAFLPIHAAGIYDTHDVEEVENVSDFVVSSYAPTLTSILELSDPVVREDFQVLTVAQASASGARRIPKTEDEVEIVQKLATGVRTLNLQREDATVQRVREGMMESDWIHLACHGQQNFDDPMSSGFLLHDDKLKLSEIVKLSLPKAEFAFLSACQTAMGDKNVAEESVHLAAGMLLSGCRGVIATTWSIRDDDGPSIAQEVYSRMFQDGKPNRKEAAYALHEAVKLLRESGADCASWVPFVHIGR